MVGDDALSGRVGGQLEGLRQQLLQCGEVLAGLVEPAAQPLTRDALRHLKQLVCRISFVGQIKSGKSSFINAFVQRPGLLPTSVTPWTTTVTNLHFCQPAPGVHSAIFTFLNKDEWRELAETGGRIRELTERLVPGFEPQLLQQHAFKLRQRAEQQLGVEFELLLGQAHFFERLAADTLLNYVCSGDFSQKGGAGTIGKYSDITKAADLYCERGPFAFPCTVTDTPGTNDPSLIRDEITRRSLGSSDIYVVVLTARQPLSDSDVALLRIMRGLNKDRIIVLINRIDDLADVETELPKVVGFVRQRLEAEFPGANIPLVCGSAWWGGQSMVFETDSVIRLLNRRSAGYLLKAGLLREEELDPALIVDADCRDRLRRSLFAMSGLPAIYHTIDMLMGAAHPTYIMRQVTRSFAEMGRACEGAARSELQILSEAAVRSAPGDVEAKIAQLAKERELLAGVTANVEASAAGIEAQLARIIYEERDVLARTLQATIDLHAARERDVLIDTLSRGRAPRVWTHEGVELRRALASTFSTGFQSAAGRLTSFHARVAPELHRLMVSLAPDSNFSEPYREPPAIPVPTVSPVARVMALDLDTSRWRTFWSRQPSPEVSGAKIEALIKAEFGPIAEELIRLAEAAFFDFSTTTIKWSFGACRNLQHALERRLRVVQAEYDEMRRAAQGPGDVQVAHDQSIGIRTQQQRLRDTEALTQHLEQLTQYMDGILQGEGVRA
jgi:hypothetical protein